MAGEHVHRTPEGARSTDGSPAETDEGGDEEGCSDRPKEGRSDGRRKAQWKGAERQRCGRGPEECGEARKRWPPGTTWCRGEDDEAGG